LGILGEIQAAVMNSDAKLGPILLKLRFLASRLGSDPLADWVKHESEGYPKDVEVPDYRIVGVTYKGTWSGPWGSGIQNAPIPSHVIGEYAGEGWVRHKVRESIAAVEELAGQDHLGIDASNLILVLQGKVYPDWACNSVTGSIASSEMAEITQVVRSRVLELTLELEKSVPEAGEVSVSHTPIKEGTNEQVTQIFNQTVYGNLNHVDASGNAQVSLTINQGDVQGMTSELVKAGIPEDAAKEFTDIVASETPGSVEQPLGPKAVEWLAQNIKKVAGGTWKIGVGVFAKVLEEAALRYYGLK
jgi:hypothetical protein